MMVYSPTSIDPTDSGLLLAPFFQEIVPIECPCPYRSILLKSWLHAAHKKCKLDDSVAFCDDFCFDLTCAESTEERGGGGVCGDSPSRRTRQKDLVEPGEGGGGAASGAASSSPSQEKQQQRPLRRGGGRQGSATSNKRHPVFRGVRKRKGGRWVSEIREPGKKSRIWLGTFTTPEMAARAYDTAAFNLRRPYAYLNFPESASSLPLLPLSSTAKQIREAAAAAAAAFPSIPLSAGGGRGHVQTSPQEDPAGSSAPPAAKSSMSICTSEREQELSISAQTASSYFDEDIIFDMPNVLTDMAEGLMITPLLLNYGNLNGSNGENDVAEPSLWDHWFT